MRYNWGMYCPVCRSEYRSGFTRCEDCSVDLVVNLPAQETAGDPDAPGLVEVLSSYDQSEVLLARSLLEAEGVVFQVQGELYPGSGVFITPVKVLVAAEDAVRAGQLLAEHGLASG